MTRRKRESGEGRLGFLVALAVVGIVGFLGFKVIPVRINAYEFRETLREEARFGAVRRDDAAVTKRILDKALDLEIPLEKKNLRVHRTRAEIIVTASYEQPIDLKLTTYVYKFRAEERAPLF